MGIRFGRDYSSRGDEHPVRTMIHSWLLCIMMPSAIITWRSTHRLSLTILATLAAPLLAIIQGALGILQYRLCFGDTPLPLTPSHGVVVMSAADNKTVASRCSANHQQQHVNSNTASSDPAWLHCTATTSAAGTRLAHVHGCECTPLLLDSSRSSLCSIPSTEEAVGQPLRVLVIGDSLAIGVGQSKSCSPILPEVLAKTLSKGLHRPVYWTCHGAPGASAGWIVRELERGVSFKQEIVSDVEEELDSVPGKGDTQSSCSETDDSSSDESSADGRRLFTRRGIVDYRSETVAQHLLSWRQSLEQHRKFFTPENIGPFDIVVVMTGSNDLKSAFFPFLLTGEDAEFRRQAKQRGGNYTKELRLLLETLNARMKVSIQNFREKVEARVEETLDRITPGRSSSQRVSRRKVVEAERESTDEIRQDSAVDRNGSDEGKSIRHFPLVVLPGMPARALPIFRIVPLRWLAVPIVDIMDTHKRKLAESHPGEVMFVRAPSVNDLADYENEKGEIWEQQGREETILNLRDIRRKDCARITSEMREYYSRRGSSAVSQSSWIPLMSRLPPAPGLESFSVDQIHPNDRGYNFWGRYIANSILEQWSSKKHL